MPASHRLLVVDENESGRLLLVWTLRQQFPRASVAEADHIEAAVARMAETSLDAIVVHRVPGLPCVDLVRAIREVSATVPVVAVSGFEQSADAALAAGATSFIHFDHWKRIGRTVANAVARGAEEALRRQEAAAGAAG